MPFLLISIKNVMPEFKYQVDGEPQETDKHELTPNEILKKAGYDPQKYYLVEIEGQKQISFKDKGNEEIHMHEHMKFITVLIQGGVPLS